MKEKALSRHSDSKYPRDGRNEESSIRVDEFSVQNWRESNGTIHTLTSQIQEMLEQMNSVND